MNAFLLDLWNDLREKRMWPVAAALLLGLIAVPVVLSKPSEEPTPTPAAVSAKPEQSAAEKGLAALTVAKDEPGDGSTLDVFDPGNPFKPPQDIIKNSEESSAPSSTSETSGGAATGDTGSGTTGGGGGTTTPGEGTKTVEFRYVIDATFISNGRKRKIKGMERLDVLPGEANPLLIFLGVGKNGGNAVFLVDSTLKTTGEGKCKPSGSECAFLYLGAGSEQEFTNDEGDSYTLRVDQIRKVKVGESATEGEKSSNRADGATSANAAIGSQPATRRFVPPLITDLVSVSTGAEELSDDGQTGR